MQIRNDMKLLLLILIFISVRAAAEGADPKMEKIIGDVNPKGPGGVVFVVKNGEAIFNRSYGLANLEHGVRITADTPFQLASLSKQFTAFAIMLLESRGEIKLDDSICKYLTALPEVQCQIQIYHLLYHTSGLRESTHLWEMSGGRHDDTIQQNNLARLIQRQESLNFTPGSQWQYSNSGYIFLAEIISAVSKTSYSNWMQENIFSPLNMPSTMVFDDSGVIVKGRAHSYHQKITVENAVSNATDYGAGNILSTANDLAKWLENFSSGKLGGIKVRDKMMSKGAINSGESISYGYGLFHQSHGGLSRVFHGGGVAGFSHAMSYYPTINAGVITLSNTSSAHSKKINDRTAEYFFAKDMNAKQALDMNYTGMYQYRGTKKERDFTAQKMRLDAYTGCYYSQELDSHYRLSGSDQLLAITHIRHGTHQLTPKSKDIFEMDVYEWFQGEVKFLRKHGRVTDALFSNPRTRNLRFNKVTCRS